MAAPGAGELVFWEKRIIHHRWWHNRAGKRDLLIIDKQERQRMLEAEALIGICFLSALWLRRGMAAPG